MSEISGQETAAHLLHATLEMGYLSATETLLSRTKYSKVGVYDTGRLAAFSLSTSGGST
jgi:hypothetical protein